MKKLLVKAVTFCVAMLIAAATYAGDITVTNIQLINSGSDLLIEGTLDDSTYGNFGGHEVYFLNDLIGNMAVTDYDSSVADVWQLVVPYNAAWSGHYVTVEGYDYFSVKIDQEIIQIP